MKKLSKRTSWILAISGIIVAGGICWGIYSYIDNKNQLADQETQVAKLEKQVNDLYADKTKELLKKDISEKEIETAEKSLDAFKGKTLLTPEITEDMAQITKNWGNADYMYTYQMQVETLLDPNGALRADADIQKVETQRADLIKNTKKETFAKSFDPVLKEASAQQNQIDVANQQVTALYSNFDKKEVKKDLTWDTYNKAKASVDKVKQAKAKQNLTTNLKPANDALKAEDEKEAQAAEAAKVAAAQEAAEASQESTVASASGNGSSSNNDSASGNSSSSASASNGTSGSSSTSGSSGSSNKSASSSNGGSGASSSSKSGSSWSAPEMKPGDTFEGTKTGEGDIEEGWSTWESGTW